MNFREPRRQPLLTDVARVAGVSVPTVSRVLNGSSPVSASRRERVLAAVADLGYVPNPAARALATGVPGAIAILASETTHYGYASTIEGIEDAARKAGFAVLISVVSGDGPLGAKASVDLVLAQSVAGVLVLDFDEAGRQALLQMPASVPVICVGTGNPPGRTVPHATIDDRAGTQVIMDHLFELGHRRIHYVAIPDIGETAERLIGWNKALDRIGVVDRDYSQATWDPASAYDIGVQLAADTAITAILCGNDDLAIGVMRALKDQGRLVPEEVSVAGFDDLPLSRYWAPSLTTVAQDFRDLGRRAVDLLLAHLAGSDAPEMSLAMPMLIKRESTGPAKLR